MGGDFGLSERDGVTILKSTDVTAMHVADEDVTAVPDVIALKP
jgi:hypothetical protein